MRAIEFLDKSGVNYEVTTHRPTFTSQRMAAVAHQPGQYVAKPVIIKADDKFIMCVLPASYRIDMEALKSQLATKSVKLAKEEDIAEIFEDCEVGAEPPFGNLYDLPTIMDKTLESDDYILFQAGTHEKSIRMSMSDYRKLVVPKVLDFHYRANS